MPLTLEGSCHCKAVKFTVESNTPVPFQICQCSICRKVGGYMGASNIMGNTGDAFKILRGEDKIKVYIAPVKFDKDDKPSKMGTSKRSFCTECSTMLWNYHDEYPQWIYPFASTIDKPDLPLVPEGVELVSIMRDSCPNYVPIPKDAKPYPGYGPGEGIEAWHKKHGAWVE